MRRFINLVMVDWRIWGIGVSVLRAPKSGYRKSRVTLVIIVGPIQYRFEMTRF